MPARLKDFLIVLAGTSSLLGIIYIGLTLTFGQTWISSNATMVFVNGLYLLLIPPFVWMVRFRPEDASGFSSPKVKVILDDGTIITEPCGWLSYRTTVSVFKLQDDVEQFVFPAYVINIQSNKLIQLTSISSTEDEIDAVELREMKEKLLIKPGHLND